MINKMKTKEIYESDKLIVNFMGIEPKSVIPSIFFWNDAPYYYTSEDTYDKVMNNIIEYVKYSSSFDWLMPVLEKIITTGHKWEIGVIEKRYYCKINEFDISYGDTVIDAIYIAIVNFIKFHN